MITVEVRKDLYQRIVGFHVHGHSCFAEEGMDIVCAAVSALFQAAIVGITEVLTLDLDHTRNKGDLFFELPEYISPDKSEKAYFLMETINQALMGIAEGYPGYILIEEVLGVCEKNKKYTVDSDRAYDRQLREKEELGKGGMGMEDKNCDDFEKKEGKKPIPWDKLLGVALLGAIGSALLYYVFLQMEEEQRQAIKETIVSHAKQAVAKMANTEND